MVIRMLLLQLQAYDNGTPWFLFLFVAYQAHYWYFESGLFCLTDWYYGLLLCT